jgi:hypothetical protein
MTMKNERSPITRPKNRVRVKCYEDGSWEISEFRVLSENVKTDYENGDDLPTWVQKAIAVIEISESGNVPDVGLRIGSTWFSLCGTPRSKSVVYWLEFEEESYV